jgi:predicted metal-dependent phosphoesterase TrpH
MICDLHLHTKASDGTYTPAELVMHAKKTGLPE